jgi:hypothetical protein
MWCVPENIPTCLRGHVPQVLLDVLPCNVTIVIDEVANILIGRRISKVLWGVENRCSSFKHTLHFISEMCKDTRKYQVQPALLIRAKATHNLYRGSLQKFVFFLVSIAMRFHDRARDDACGC